MKRALVTGASGDIGSAIASRLGKDGLHVIVHGHTGMKKATSVAERIRQTGGSAEVLLFDVTDARDVRSALSGVLDQGPIQVVVNNAGIHLDAPMAGMENSQWREVIDVSLNGFFNVTQPLLLPMMGTRWGRVVNISSISGVMGNRGQTNYSAAKAGLHGATKSLAIELASRGITVNSVAPGIINGEQTEKIFDKDTIDRLIPMKRAGEPKEVAALVGFLVSEEAAYISGQVISINGAMA